MPGPEFFERLGLFAARDFLDGPLCDQIATELSAAVMESGVILSAAGRQVNEDVRRVHCADAPSWIRQLVEDRLETLRPRLEAHFNVPLEPRPAAEFLVYQEGGHYAVHRDSSSDPSRPNHHRRVSVCVFLNPRSGLPLESGYSGGALVFHQLMKGPEWERCAFALDADPGLLIAFHADLPHEVTPVTAGCRCAIVSWFLTRYDVQRVPCFHSKRTERNG